MISRGGAGDVLEPDRSSDDRPGRGPVPGGEVQAARHPAAADAAVTRRFALLAAASATVGAIALVATVASTAVGYGYVSEAGSVDAPLPGVYRVGIFAVALAVAALAMSLRPLGRGGAWRDLRRSSRRPAGSALGVLLETPLAVRAAVLALATAAPLAATSGAVPCSPGCPLPPFETPSQADILHAGVSIAALAFSALAMLLLAATTAAGERLRRISLVGAGLAVPLLAAAGLALVLIGRGYLTGILERAAVLVALGWLLAAALARTRA